MFAVLAASFQELNSNFCYPVDGHNCIRSDTSIFDEAKDIVPKSVKTACKAGNGGSFRGNGCVDYHGGEQYIKTPSAFNI
mmetsp:Transcript_67417/g.98620  ORF Transcript_67417/g.98620 Transcript_67417/m.98620 type:complete len:80 (-) Transcript_67417:136-375(-)